MGRQKNIYPRSDPKLTLTLTLSLILGLGLRLTPRKRISVGNLKPNAKKSILVDVQGKIFRTWVDEKIFILEVTPS